MRRFAPRQRTLRGRVSLVALAVIAGWLVVLAVGLDVTVSRRLNQQIDDTLELRAQAVSTAVEIAGSRLIGVRESSTDSELDSGVWVFAGRQAVARPHAPERTAQAAAELAGAPPGYVSRHDRRFYVLALQSGGRRIGTVVTALDTDPYLKTERLVVIASAAVAALMLLGAYPVLRISAARALRPVTAMTNQAAAWSVTAPGQRFGADQRYTELRSLAGMLDELLDRVSALLRHERQLTAELSHEIRTPLTRMRTEADLALAGETDQHSAALHAIRDNCDALSGMIDVLLTAGRSDIGRQTVVAHAEVDSVIDLFATTEVPTTSTSKSGLSVGVDAEVVERILAPIVANARRFAATHIRLDAHRAGPSVVVTVANDGPRVPPEYAQRIFQPGFRVSDGRDVPHDGVGLGLALAQRLAHAADGEISVDVDAEWTTFRVVLPAG